MITTSDYLKEAPIMKRFPPLFSGGVVGVLCACCGKRWIIINLSDYDMDFQFCTACMNLPEAEAEAMILKTEPLIWQFPIKFTPF